ncbi:MAG: DUF374 domain-containing protein [Myxococcota bacterium]
MGASERRTTSGKRRAKKALRRVLMTLGLYTVPYLYVAYMWFVYKTSRVEEIGFRPDQVRAEVGEGVWALWHDEVFFVAWSFRNYRPDTLASRGDSGAIITKMLQLCNFNVFRGGSSSSQKRRTSVDTVQAMIDHMKHTPGVLYGITTDGSTGPVYRMKRGAVSIAVACESRLFAEKTWCKRYYRLPTWDRSLIPLPFNHIVHVYGGPIHPPRDAWEPKRFEELCRETERYLCQLTAYARARVEGLPLPQDWLDQFPEEVREEMARAELPELRRPIRPVEIDVPAGVPEGAVPGGWRPRDEADAAV